MSQKSAALILIIALVSFALGAALSRQLFPAPGPARLPDQATVTPQRSTPPSSESQQIRLLRQENSDLRRQLQSNSIRQANTDAELRDAVIADRLRLVRDFPNDFPLVAALDVNLKVTSSPRNMLSMTPEEIALVQEEVAAAKARSAALDARHFVIIEETPEKLVFGIQPHEEGRSIGEDLTASVRRILGDTRGQIFLKGCEHLFNTEFSGFGTNPETKVEITWDPTGRAHQIKQTWTPANGNTGWSSGTFTELPARYRDLLEIKTP